SSPPTSSAGSSRNASASPPTRWTAATSPLCTVLRSWSTAWRATGLLQRPDDARRIAGDDNVRRHVPGDDGARPDNGVLPDRDPGQHDDAAPQPCVLLDDDRFGRFPL